MVDDKPVVNQKYCSRCSQCAAICPVRAITWNGSNTSPYDSERLPTAEQLDELFKQRRSIRTFKNKRVDRSILEEIINYGIYAPTHNYSLRTIVVDEVALIQDFDKILVRFVTWVSRIIYEPKIVGWLARVLGMEEEYLLNKPKIDGVLNEGRAFNYPAAMIFIVGDKKIPLSVDSAQYALANITFYAQVKGLACCLWGNGPIFMDKSPKARKLLQLERQDRIFGAMLIGYPEIKFRNKVEGRRMPIQWI
jgi:nitroreductase